MDSKYENVIKASNDDKDLVAYINLYRKTLEDQGVKIFKQVNNNIVTENGYFLTVYNDDKIIKV